MTRLIKRRKVEALTGNLAVSSCFAAIPTAVQSLRVISVIMILMYGHDLCRGIYHWNPHRAGAPDQPVVPPETADYQRRNVTVRSSGKNEIINGMLTAPLTAIENMALEAHLPIGGPKFPGSPDIDFPTAADQEEAIAPSRHLFNSTQKIAHQHDVAVDVSDKRMASQVLSLCEDAAQVFGPSLTSLDLLHVPNPQFARRFGCSRIISDQYDLNVWAEEQPTLDRIARSEERRVGKECRSRWSPYH